MAHIKGLLHQNHVIGFADSVVCPPVEEPLDVILQAKGLGMVRRGNLIRVAPLSTLEKERELFGADHATVGKPSRPDFLLRPGELLAAASGLRIVAYEDGFCSDPERFVQRLVAVREDRADGTILLRSGYEMSPVAATSGDWLHH